jgi:hypothetical protein
MKRNMADGAAWSAAKAKATAHASVAAGRATYSWAALGIHHVSDGWLIRAKPPIDLNHRALVVRRSSALICFEPKQGRFPALPAG